MDKGALYIISTPIGNLEDIAVRAIKTIFSVDYLLCEDTRTTGILLTEIQKRYTSLIPLSFKKPVLIPYYDEVENTKAPEVINHLLDGKNCGLISENGTPLISDPGFVVVREAIRRNIKVIPIPGPTAAITALSISGLPVHNFYFGGYLPKKQNKRLKFIKSLLLCFETLEHKPTLIFYETPHRLNQTLTDLINVVGDKHIVICRELTKIHEEIFRGTISEAITHFSQPKGEFVILF
ncbi:16S rRNA (cytidine(1402)-2'-O)-methyltransferase [Candidatus Gottesmanbacteria bacterium]|nr:16S rRNA (cytidine(1402)-2'-O)-methyltransferase [Candidatus Gottesmanbacteria bacterium]